MVRGAVQPLTVAAALLAALVFTAGAGGVGGPPLAVSPVAIAAGGHHSCIVTGGGGVRCWGQSYGAKPLDITGLSGGASTIAVGFGHDCALTNAGGVKCWGNNFAGALGDGTAAGSVTPVDVVGLSSGVTAVAVGYTHSCALSGAGAVKCWGGNRIGQVGDGTTNDRSTAVAVSGLQTGVKAIAAGSYHSCALTAKGGVECWGDAYGPTPVQVSGLQSGVVAIAAGFGHNCALTSAGGVRCWGSNPEGQLGDGTTSSRATSVDVVGLNSGVTAIAAGGEHTCALTTSGAVECWGADFRGELGDGTSTFAARATPVGVSGLSSDVSAIAAGSEHSCALMTTGDVKCWGRGDFGQLGDGTKAFGRWTPVGVVGYGAAATLALASRSVKVSRARLAPIALSCGAGADCKGTLTLSAQLRLGSRSFAISPGETRPVAVKLSTRGFKLLVRVRHLKARVSITYAQPSGTSTTATGAITLIAPR
jgi:alpha-tubulin suppressor-like RCC1 family protein